MKIEKRGWKILIIVLIAIVLVIIVSWPFIIEPYIVKYYGSWRYGLEKKSGDNNKYEVYFKESVSIEEAIDIVESYDLEVASFPNRYFYDIELISGNPDEYVEIIKSSKLPSNVYYIPPKNDLNGIIYVDISTKINDNEINNFNDFIVSYDNLRIKSVKDLGMSLEIRIPENKQKKWEKLEKNDKVKKTFIEPPESLL